MRMLPGRSSTTWIPRPHSPTWEPELSAASPLNHAAQSLVDSFNRRIDYLRVSVTDRRDLRAQYCLPEDFKEFEEPAPWLGQAVMAGPACLFVGLGAQQ